MYEMATGNRVYEFQPNMNKIADHIFSTDGKTYVATDGSRAALMIYNLDNKIQKLINHLLE